MSYLHLASHAISETMFDPNHNGDAANNSPAELPSSSSLSPESYFQRSLSYWPTNPACHSLLANYYRMNSLASTEDVCSHYVMAAKYANCWRRLALDFLQSPSELEQEDEEQMDDELKGKLNTKEWVELLVLNGALDVDYIGDDDDDDDEDEDKGNGDHSRKENDDIKEEYSCSEVEATASFMSAFLLSTLSRHDEALPYLQKFQLSHRIHPNVWREAQSSKKHDMTNTTRSEGEKSHGKVSSTVLFQPRIYHGGGDKDGNGVLPPQLYNRLCSLLAPNATYWNESDYNNRGYYSYFIDLDSINGSSSSTSVRQQPTNVIEDVIVNHLLPLAEKTLKESYEEDYASVPHIVGAEWWAHTRPLGANLGHQVHFDTDESLLGREKKVTHPIISSVLYLTGAQRESKADDKDENDVKKSAGSTIVFDQTPDSTDVASKAWISHPENNAFMIFPGNLLHGVLPCAGNGGTGDKTRDGTNGDSSNAENNRLTFMVGFWTRRVTDGMGQRQLYSPCGPLPPATSEHSWVIDSQRGYCKQEKQQNGGSGNKSDHRRDLQLDLLPSAFPAWEKFDCKSDTSTNALTIPKGLDHRFFVWNAPHCFSESLFDKEDCF